jgi:hypothetical protein
VPPFAIRADSADFTPGHSASVTENMALSRSLPSSPGTCDGDQFRSTPSNRAPSPSIARRDRWLRASVFQSTRTTPSSSNACWRRSSFASALIPVRCADAASHVPPISTAPDQGSLEHHGVDRLHAKGHYP